MTIRFTKSWNGYYEGQIVTNPNGGNSEAQLIALGYAVADLDGPDNSLQLAKLATDSTGNVTGLVGPGGGVTQIGSHVSACCIGDSITSRSRYSGTVSSSSALGIWNWANWMVGSPFVFRHNFGVSGDVTKSIMTRIAAIPSNVQVVFLMTGTNDVYSMSAAAVQGTIDSTYTIVSGHIGAGVAALVASGKRVVIATIPPNNAYTPNTDSRIQLLDRLNAYIASLASGSVFVADCFTAFWDSAQPTLRVCKANTMHSDGTHPAAAGSMLAGKAAMAATAAAYATCMPDYDLYNDFSLARQLYTGFRSGTNGDAAVKTAGTGTLGDGWRSINQAGTATFTLANTNAYTTSGDYIGPWAEAPEGVDDYWQEFNITSATTSDNVRLRLPASTSVQSTGAYPDSIMGGDLFFGEMDVWVKSAVNLTTAQLQVFLSHTQGTSPVDQPYTGTNYLRGDAASVTDSASSIYAYAEGFRAVLRTPVIRAPENINTTVTQNLDYNFDMIFNGAGSALIWLGRPRLWIKRAGFLG